MINASLLDKLTTLMEERKSADPDKSYVARLYKKGPQKIAQKVGEEAVELAIAAVSQDEDAIKGEAADLLFHLMVLLSDKGMTLADVITILGEREGIGGLDEKASRPD